MPTPGNGSTAHSLPSLQELSRIMDVASTLRRERDTALQQFGVAETKTILRKRLLEAAELAGEALSSDEVDAAIAQYYENLHAFQAPEPGWRLSLAKLYIHRNRYLGRVAIVTVVFILLVWGVSLARGASPTELTSRHSTQHEISRETMGRRP